MNSPSFYLLTDAAAAQTVSTAASVSLNADDIDTSGGYTVDGEGLINNYAVEPEMYYDVPGDLKVKEDAETEARTQELAEVNQTDEIGKLTDKADNRGKGVGMI